MSPETQSWLLVLASVLLVALALVVPLGRRANGAPETADAVSTTIPGDRRRDEITDLVAAEVAPHLRSLTLRAAFPVDDGRYTASIGFRDGERFPVLVWETEARHHAWVIAGSVSVFGSAGEAVVSTRTQAQAAVAAAVRESGRRPAGTVRYRTRFNPLTGRWVVRVEIGSPVGDLAEVLQRHVPHGPVEIEVVVERVGGGA